MDNLIDPLRIHTQGVKKPLEDKGQKLQSLADNNQRYYPTDPRGNLDEWGAVIKRQTEAYNREQYEKSVAKAQNARQYGAELAAAMRQKQAEAENERKNRLNERDDVIRAVAARDMQNHY